MNFEGLTLQEVIHKLQAYYKKFRSDARGFPPMVKLTLSDPYTSEFEEFDITQDIPGDSDFEIVLDRDGTADVMLSVGMPFSMKELAYDFIREAWDRYGIKCRININIYKRDDYDVDNYTLVTWQRLDFDSIEIKTKSRLLEISGIKMDLNEYINSRGKIKFDIPVKEVADSVQLGYQRLNLESNCTYTLPTGEDIPENVQYIDPNSSSFLPLMNMNTPEMVFGSPEHTFQTQPFGYGDPYNLWFFKAANPRDGVAWKYNINIELDFDLEVTHPLSNLMPVIRLEQVKYTYWPDGSTTIKETIEVAFYPMTLMSTSGMSKYYAHWQRIISNIEMEVGDTLRIRVDIPGGEGAYYRSIDYDTVKVFYYSSGSGIDTDVDIINPLTLFQKLLDKMTDDERMFTAGIDWDDMQYIYSLCAAESIRSFDNAIIHTSFNDFDEWMKIIGYELSYNENTRNVIYKLRDNCFDKDKVTLELKEHEFADVVIKGSNDYSYTSVKIGYDKIDYSSVNGRFEVVGTFEYSTGYINSTENALELISPYRADCIGFDLLLQQRGTKTTDTTSDNDIFALVLAKKTTSGKYRIYKTEYINVGRISGTDIKGLELYNVPLLPNRLALLNESLIGITTSKLLFESTDSYREGVLSSGNLYGDINIEKKLFEPILYNLAAGNFIPLPDADNRNGLVYFPLENKICKGFIQTIKKNYMLETEETWTLHAVK